LTVQTLSTIGELQAAADAARVAGKHIALVPTMGALHKGHISLIERARSMADVVVTSIFVNPAQFGPQEDFEKYPRDLVRDSAQAQAAGTDILFTPDVAVMYPRGFQTYIDNNRLATILEGLERPGHFRGVTTVVTKLFNIVRPHLAFFGQKDYQQALVIRQMVKDLHLEVKIVTVPTVRDPDGLAVSSRNAYLLAHERQAARVLNQSLLIGREMILGGERDARRIQSQLEAYIKKEPLARIEYVSISNPQTLQEVQKIEGKTLIALVVWIGKTRLIDNIIVRQS